jgi:RHS repeat-associated protein
LSDTETGTKEYVARDYITLKPGFNYIANEDNTFTARIDECLLFPPTDATYGTPEGAAGATPSSGGIVGTIPGKFEVSSTGAATYTIPIEVPKGVNGMEPQVSLVYNSQAGNGIAGWGWNIGGLSMISRAPKNLYFDNKVSGIDWTKESPLVLDGQRLMKVSESNGQIEYRTESESFSKIIGKNIRNWGPAIIEVHTKDGKILTYGNPNDPYSYFVLFAEQRIPLCQVFVDGQNLGWSLTKMEDQNGNYIIYKYTGGCSGQIASGRWGTWDSHIEKIQYGGNSNVGTPNSIELNFVYENRVDPISGFVNGHSNVQNKRLQKIIIKNGSIELRKYRLEYKSLSTVSILREINMTNGNLSFNSTTFKVGNNIGLASRDKITRNFCSNLPHGMSSVVGLVSLDFAGDGVEDIGVLFADASHYYGVTRYYLRIFDKTKTSGGFSISQRDKDYYMGISIKAFGTEMSGSISNRLFGDFFNEGAISALNISEGKAKDGRFLISLSFVSFINQEEKRSDFVHLEQEKRAVPFAVVGDFTENVSSDVVIIRDIPKSTEERHTYKATLVSDIGQNKNDFSIDTPSKIKEVFAQDFNGDGKDDLFLLLEDGSMICENIFNGTDFFSSPNEAIANLKEGCLFKFGDINNDKNIDIVYRNANDFWTIAYSKGNGDFSFKNLSSIDCVNQDDSSKDKDNVFIVDVNQDGLLDIVVGDEKLKAEYHSLWGYFERYNYEKTNWQYFIQKGSGFELFKEKSNIQRAGERYHFFGDYNYSGVRNWLWLSTEEGIYKNYIKYGETYSSKEKMIKEIKNGIGQKININYSNLTWTADYIKNIIVPTNLRVIKSAYYPIVSNYEDKGIKYDLSYQNCVVYPKGKGLLGFLSITKRNLKLGIEQTNKFTLNSNYYTLIPISKEIRYGNSGIISQTIQDITIVSKGSKRYWARTNSVTSKDFLENRSTKQTYSAYDSYGNPKTIKTEYLANGSNSGIYETKSITYTNAGSWCPNKPETVTVTKTNKNGSQTRTHKYSYDQKGNLTKKQRDVGDKNELVTIYDNYDSFGNPRIITTKANGKSRSTTLEYTASGRFMKKKTDDFTGFSTKYNYNETTGVLTSETDHSGLTTTYEYDGFGRQIKATYPDGRYAVKTYQWAGGYGPNGAVYYTYEEISGESPVWTWYDGLGRELRTEYYGFDDSKKIWVDTDYNSKGQIESISKPYFANGTKEPAETYTYDNYGRVSTKTTPMGTTSITYNGLTTSISSPRSEKEETRNAAGQIVTSKTDGGTVSFTYYPSGKVKTATPQDGAAVEMYYNLQGNRTKIIDPDAGTIETTYNGYGELISEKYTMGSGEDERTVITSYTYDDIGRPDVIDRNGEIIDYSYNSDGFLQSVTKPDHEVIYTYDEGSDKKLGRLTSVKEQIDGKIFSFRTAYDAFGREKKRTYPSGFSVDNVYTKYGHLKEVTDSNGKSIWKGEKVNAHGQFVKTSKGGKTTTFGYDEKDRLESIVSPDIINHFYVFNEKGNLESREDKLTGQLESFTYDKHQLKTWKIKQGGVLKKTFSMNYDAQGNITGKSDLGYVMEYKDDRPHAISGIRGNPVLISDAIQEVTYTDFKKLAYIAELHEKSDSPDPGKGYNEGDYQRASGSPNNMENESNLKRAPSVPRNVYSLELAYGVDDQRRKAVFKTNGETTLTRYYLGDYEEEQTTDGKTRKIHYLSGGNGLAAIFVEENSTARLYYAYTDYLGSLTALTDKNGNIVERQAFDPWGNRRNPNDWTSLVTTPVSHITGRGYTMHEHLDRFALINMNGRVYDPQIARFLSPDPQLQAPGYWLNYNRYGYCYNNPLIYTDPSGEWILETLFVLGFSYLAGAHDNRDRETGEWEWNPGNWHTPIVFGFSTNSNGSNFNAGASVGGQVVFSTKVIANSGSGNSISIPSCNFGTGDEFYSNLSPSGALRDMIIFPGLRLNYQVHGVSVDMTTGSLMFDDSSIGYEYMWNKSFDNEYGYSVAAREVSGLVLQSGKVVVMPYYKNTVSQSENSYLETQDGFRQVKFNNQWYPVLTHIHTHPQFAPAKDNPIGLSRRDLRLQQKIGRPIFIIYDRAIYSIDGTYNYEKNMWNFEQLMIW